MARWLETSLTIICAVLASSGFWAFIQTRRERKDAKTRMLLGLGHDRIIFLSMKYIERGWITQDEYSDLIEYLYNPYREMGGNGTAKRIIEEVQKLPIHHVTYVQQAKNEHQEETPN